MSGTNVIKTIKKTKQKKKKLIKEIEGEGLMLAIVVGPNSTQGKIDEILLTQDELKSPL
jgi:hypothetical protein